MNVLFCVVLLKINLLPCLLKVDDLEDYVMSRRVNDSTELRNEYKVRGYFIGSK